jgi:hypothetical protein
MYKIGICLPLILSLFIFSCTEKPEELNLDPETEALMNILQDELLPLGKNPLTWTDQELRWLDYFENEKIVLWAHNGHISNFEYGVTGSMGNYLSYQLGDQYAILGFLFSKGTFTAVGMEGETYSGPGTQTLDTIPKENSLNALMSYSGEPAFSIELEVIRNYLGWYNAFEKGMEYFQMGSVYNNHPEDYYIVIA